MSYAVIAIIWAAFAAFVVAARLMRRAPTLIFVITALLAVIGMALWGALRNF